MSNGMIRNYKDNNIKTLIIRLSKLINSYQWVLPNLCVPLLAQH